MKYTAVLLLGIFAITLGCNEDEVNIPPAEQFDIDTKLIDDWITENNIQDTLINNISQIRYTINEEGSGISPRAFIGDSILVDFEGRILTTGEVFDSSDSLVLALDVTIRGWQIMLPEMKEGDEFTIYLQSIYGYATEGRATIPPNAILVFDIRLLRVGG